MYYGPEHYLGKDAATGRIMAHAQLLLRLARRFEAVAPSILVDQAHVANYRSGTIIIHADNGAVAVKLRQISRRLCNELSQAGCECSDIEVKVQPRETLFQSNTSAPRLLSETAQSMLLAMGGKLPDGPLKTAIGRLASCAPTKK